MMRLRLRFEGCSEGRTKIISPEVIERDTSKDLEGSLGKKTKGWDKKYYEFIL